SSNKRQIGISPTILKRSPDDSDGILPCASLQVPTLSHGGGGVWPCMLWRAADPPGQFSEESDFDPGAHLNSLDLTVPLSITALE
ncbi:hypothetical protein AVEN_252720-1, partial [Araneus ventricosus]